MKLPIIPVSLLAVGLMLAPTAHAELSLTAKVEISFLLGFVDGSGCQFNRNGTWYDSKAAQEHLRDKYNYLKLRNLINTTEDFIVGAATESSLSGMQYAVRCNGGATVTSRRWLTDELARVRSLQ
jgi:hypothetical protein